MKAIKRLTLEKEKLRNHELIKLGILANVSKCMKTIIIIILSRHQHGYP